MQISVVMPCLNESATIGICIGKARMALKEMRAEGEISGQVEVKVEVQT